MKKERKSKRSLINVETQSKTYAIVNNHVRVTAVCFNFVGQFVSQGCLSETVWLAKKY